MDHRHYAEIQSALNKHLLLDSSSLPYWKRCSKRRARNESREGIEELRDQGQGKHLSQLELEC